MPSYQFGFRGPSDAWLSDQIGGSFTSHPPSQQITRTIDLADAANLTDLIYAMNGAGWEYLPEGVMPAKTGAAAPPTHDHARAGKRSKGGR